MTDHPIVRCRMAKRLLVLIAFLAGGLAMPEGAVARSGTSAAELMDSLMWAHEPVEPSFALTDHHGKLRTHDEFKGKLLIIYFGYMFCPDICPTDLQVIAEAIDQLGPAGEDVQPLFVTVDPERDTSKKLAGYVELFHPRLIGLTGTLDEIRGVARRYKVYFEKSSEGSMSTYVLDHSAFIYLVDAAGRYVGFLPPGTTPLRLADIIRVHLSNSAK